MGLSSYASRPCPCRCFGWVYNSKPSCKANPGCICVERELLPSRHDLPRGDLGASWTNPCIPTNRSAHALGLPPAQTICSQFMARLISVAYPMIAWTRSGRIQATHSMIAAGVHIHCKQYVGVKSSVQDSLFYRNFEWNLEALTSTLG